MKAVIGSEGLTIFGLFVRLTDDGAEWVHSPEHATQFDSKKVAKQWIADNIATDATSMLVIGPKEHKVLVEGFKQYLANGMPGAPITLIDRSKTALFDPSIHNQKDVLDWLWWYKHADDRSVPYSTYSSWANAIYTVKTRIFHEFIAYYKTDDHREKCYGMEIKIDPELSFEDFQEELMMLLDNYDLTREVIYEPSENKGYSGIGINLFTDDLCSSGIPYLVMIDRENDQWAVVMQVYGTIKERIPPCSLEECFAEMVQRGYTYSD